MASAPRTTPRCQTRSQNRTDRPMQPPPPPPRPQISGAAISPTAVLIMAYALATYKRRAAMIMRREAVRATIAPRRGRSGRAPAGGPAAAACGRQRVPGFRR
jgi:hypothetical protein